MTGLNAVQAMTAVLIKKQKDETLKAEQAREQAAQKERERATPQTQSRPQTVNAVLLRQNWYQGITQPFLKKQAAKKVTKNAGVQKKAMNHRRVK